ncbi:hypothetical protein JYK04_08199 [Streptomyces nojiriensis]|nr:hypothetical protein JYK04_08199 [Streptomyces nojiriensis]
MAPPGPVTKAAAVPPGPGEQADHHQQHGPETGNPPTGPQKDNPEPPARHAPTSTPQRDSPADENTRTSHGQDPTNRPAHIPQNCRADVKLKRGDVPAAGRVQREALRDARTHASRHRHRNYRPRTQAADRYRRKYARARPDPSPDRHHGHWNDQSGRRTGHARPAGPPAGLGRDGAQHRVLRLPGRRRGPAARSAAVPSRTNSSPARCQLADEEGAQGLRPGRSVSAPASRPRRVAAATRRNVRCGSGPSVVAAPAHPPQGCRPSRPSVPLSPTPRPPTPTDPRTPAHLPYPDTHARTGLNEMSRHEKPPNAAASGARCARVRPLGRRSVRASAACPFSAPGAAGGARRPSLLADSAEPSR